MDKIKCSKCGTPIDEPVNTPIDKREPCRTCGSTMRDKEIVIEDFIKFEDTIKAVVRDEVLWSSARVSLLGIWMTVYITFYVTAITLNGNDSLFETLAYAAIAGLLGFAFLAPFRYRKITRGFFWYFDWVAGSEKKTTWRSFIIVIVFLVAILTSWILAWVFG